MTLFQNQPHHFNLPDSDITYFPDFFTKEKADRLFAKLQAEIPWQQDEITVFGKTHPQPRLTALFGNEGKRYGYSGIVMQPHSWNTLLTHIKEAVEQAAEIHFTTVLLNYYRDGKDKYSEDLPRFIGYARKTAGRYGALKPLLALFDALEGKRDEVGYTF